MPTDNPLDQVRTTLHCLQVYCFFEVDGLRTDTPMEIEILLALLHVDVVGWVDVPSMLRTVLA